MFIFDIPLGVWYLILILVFICLKFKYRYTYVNTKILNIIIYILTLGLIASLIYFSHVGFTYPCSCGCGSEEIEHGLLAIKYFFTKNGRPTISYYAFSYFSYIIFASIIIHIIVLLIKYFTNKIK